MKARPRTVGAMDTSGTHVDRTGTGADTGPKVLIIGSGPSGLSCAAQLQRRGARVTVLERGERVAQAWASRYDGFRFNTSRRYSALVDRPFPTEYGQFPTRDQYVDYLEDYRDSEQLTVRTGCTAERVDRDGAGWSVQTSTGPMSADHVIVATGAFNRPQVPEWAQSPRFAGTVVHASEYRNSAPFVGHRVLVVGAGCTGLEIAHQLARDGAESVQVAVRTPPTIILREFHGRPGDLGAQTMMKLPTPLVDRMMAARSRQMIGDLTPYGMPAPTEGPITRLKTKGVGPSVVDPEVLAEIRDGSIRIVPAAVGLTDDTATLADGTSLPIDALVLATGYSTGLEGLIGHLGVLDDRGVPLDGHGRELAPGLRCVGYVALPGLTGYVSRLARRVAREICPGRRQPLRGLRRRVPSVS